MRCPTWPSKPDALPLGNSTSLEQKPPQRSYSMIEVRYRDGQTETFPPDYRFASDGADARVLWVLDAVGPVYRRLMGLVESISLKEVAA